MLASKVFIDKMFYHTPNIIWKYRPLTFAFLHFSHAFENLKDLSWPENLLLVGAVVWMVKAHVWLTVEAI